MSSLKIIRNNKGQFLKGCTIATLNKGKKKPLGFGERISKARLGHKHSIATKLKMSLVKKGNKNAVGNKSNTGRFGSDAPCWIEDRSLVIKSEKKHLDGNYKTWMKAVKNRDSWCCRLSDKDCKGRLEAHHIFEWKLFPEKRYDLNNGISLCQFHHPLKKRAVEMREFFIKLLSA